MFRPIQVLVAFLLALVVSLVLLPESYYKPRALSQILSTDGKDSASASDLTDRPSTLVQTNPDSTKDLLTDALPFWSTLSSEHRFPSHKLLQVAVVEANGWHDEVHAAYLHSFASQPDVKVRAFKEAPRFGIADIIAGFEGLPNGPPELEPWENIKQPLADGSEYIPDVLVLVTCAFDLAKLDTQLKKWLAHESTYVFCTLHHADEWFGPRDDLDKALRPWAEQKRVEFVTLSEGVAQTLNTRGFSSWPSTGANIIDRSVITYPPIFPARLTPLTPESHTGASVGVQGLFEAHRRDFATVFSEFQKLVDTTQASADTEQAPAQDLSLNLIGSGGSHPKVPDVLLANVFFHDDLPYEAYYQLLSKQTVLLPAFANDGYLWNRASSSIPAALIGGVPLIVTPKILAAYSFLTPDAVYIRQPKARSQPLAEESTGQGNAAAIPGTDSTLDPRASIEDGQFETDFEALQRILAAPPAWRLNKARSVRRHRDRLIQSNVFLIKQWCGRARARTGAW